MAEELEPTNQVDEEPHGEESKTDWKAEARKWEKYAKENKAARDELEALKAAQMTEQEKANARAEAAEKELEALKTEKAKTDAAQKLANETGVPFEMLMFCKDEESMTDFAKTYAKETHVPAAPKAKSGSRIITGNEKPSNSAVFAEIAGQFFK